MNRYCVSVLSVAALWTVGVGVSAGREADRDPAVISGQGGADEPAPKRRPENGPGEKKSAKKGDSKRGISPEMFNRLDRNSDGSLTKEELPERMGQFFDRLDASGDGKISKDEFEQARKRMEAAVQKNTGPDGRPKPSAKPGADEPKPSSESPTKPGDKPKAKRPAPGGKGGSSNFFQRFDKDKDGKISSEEAPEFMKRNFERLDANSDGSLSAEEVAKGARRQENSEKPGTPAGKGASNPRTAAGEFQRMDKDGDGKITREELPERARANFVLMDSDKSGDISREELARAFESMMRRGGAAAGGPRPPKQIFNDQDTDADGALTKQEAKGVFAEQFERLDANGDKTLDIREVENGLDQDKPAKKQ